MSIVKTVFAEIMENPDLRMFREVCQTAGIRNEILQSGPWTILAPVDQPAGASALLRRTESARAWLSHYLIRGVWRKHQFRRHDYIGSLAGKRLQVDHHQGETRIAGARITGSLYFDDGDTLHFMDSVFQISGREAAIL